MLEIDDITKTQQEAKKKLKLISKAQKKSKKRNSVIDLLLELPFINILPPYTIQEIYHSITQQNYRKNEVVLNQGDTISNLYIVKSGSFILTINHESITKVSQDIYSFIKYQSITEEPFLEKRKYELDGKIKNNEQVSVFIYQKEKIFGDIEIISGRNTSIFNISANEDNSSLYIIDRIKWVRLTRRIRIMFTKMTLKKIEMIYERISNILNGKNYRNIDKMKLYQEKIHDQIEINDNFYIYSQKIEKRENQLKNEVDKYRFNKIDEKVFKEKSRSLRNFQNNKDYLLKLFKFPNILKEDIKSDLNKYIFTIKEKDTQRFRLRNTISKFNLEQDPSKYNIISNNDQNLNSILFMTNIIKPKKNYSANNIFELIQTQKDPISTRLKNIISQENKNKSPKNNSPSLINFLRNNKLLSRTIEQKFYSKSISELKNNIKENLLSKKMDNILLQTFLNNKTKKITMKPLIPKRRNISNKNNKLKFHSEYKREKMNKNQIEYILKKKCESTKDKLIEKLFGKRKDEGNS